MSPCSQKSIKFKHTPLTNQLSITLKMPPSLRFQQLKFNTPKLRTSHTNIKSIIVEKKRISNRSLIMFTRNRKNFSSSPKFYRFIQIKLLTTNIRISSCTPKRIRKQYKLFRIEKKQL